MGNKRGKNNSKAGSSTRGNTQKTTVESDAAMKPDTHSRSFSSQKDMSNNSLSDTDVDERAGNSYPGIRNYPTTQHQHRSNRVGVGMGNKRGKNNSKAGSSTRGNTQKTTVESDAAMKPDTHSRSFSSQKDMSNNSLSDTDVDERAGADGEAILWEEANEIYSDAILKLPDVGKDMVDHDAEQYINEAIRMLGLERTKRMKITSRPLNKCQVPTPPRDLTNKFFRCEGFSKDAELAFAEKSTTFTVLEPVLKEAPSAMTNTLAQEFIRSPFKLWWNDSSLKLQTSIPYHHKFLLWARMMLVSAEDKEMLLKADIFRGVLASLYQIPINTSLLAAFLTFWNSEGHTLVTTQGEMGYPLIAMYDTMGIPISAYTDAWVLQQEGSYSHVTLQSWIDHFIGEDLGATVKTQAPMPRIVRVLHTAYTDAWVLQQEGSYSHVTLQSWIDHFIGEDLGATVKTQAPMPSHFYADPEDPLLSRLDFRTLELQNRWSARFSNYRVFHQQQYGRVIYRAAFIAAWLCTYCVPVHMGAYIRPEVFCAAARLAQGVRLAIGTASMAHLYQSLDNASQNIIDGSESASECQLAIPAHFIMGWFSSYWKMTPSQPGVNPKITHFPPFVTDAWRITSTEISLFEAHRLFIDLATDNESLLSLSFLGKSCIRFPKSESEVLLSDARESVDGTRNTIRITTIDMLISSSVGAVTHTRCQFHHNLVYCPHRFARMHACDQDVPDFFMEGPNGQFLLQFSTYLKGTREETTEHLQRRHLAYYFPTGHRFHLQPLSRRTKCSAEYKKWCMSALNFFTKADMICSGQEPPCTPQGDEINASSITAACASKIKSKNTARVVTPAPTSSKGNETAPDSGSSIPVVTHSLEENIPTSGKKNNTACDGEKIRTIPELETMTVIPPVDKVFIRKRSNPKDLAARFLKLSSSHKDGRDQKEDVAIIEAPVPISSRTEVSLPGDINVLQGNRGKRSSPQHVPDEEKTDLLAPVVEDQELDVMIEQQGDHDDGSPIKKQRLDCPDGGHNLEVALSKAAALKSSLDQTVKCYLNSVGDEFTILKRNPDENCISKHGERTGIVVPQFTDPILRSMMGYIHSDLKRIHKLIASPILDKISLSTRIGRVLNSWRNMLQDKIPQEVQELMSELERLRENLNSKVEHAVSFSISSMRADEEHVKEQLSIGQKSHGSIMVGFNSLKDYGSVWDTLKDEVKQRKKEQVAKIKELTDALGNARSKLFLEQEYEKKLHQLHSQYDEIVSGASDALSRLEKTLAQGSSCLESITKAIEKAGSLGDSELPISLREQLKFVESCVVEGVDDNDE
uniref:Uncharacterized protein n=1 Tax=Avena sativa TaxID=4498 RepID=A0ACD5ZA90_AVESA